MKHRFLLALPLVLMPIGLLAAPPVGDPVRGGKIHRGEITIEGAAACSTCHGQTGNDTINGTFPKLAGQYPEYLVHALKSYADGSRDNAVMKPIASALSQRDMEDVAAFYGQQAGDLDIIPLNR
jgi:cytochrome c553